MSGGKCISPQAQKPTKNIKGLLSFPSIDDAMVATHGLKTIHKQTWQHPKSKQWCCIDYTIMKKAHQGNVLFAVATMHEVE